MNPQSDGYRILVVDDEQDILEFLGYNLRKEGYEVQTAEDGKTAIEVAKLMRPHLVLLDVMMPGMDGIETCRRFREEPKLKDTVIAFLTARAEDYSQIAGLDAGADDYVTKPVKPRVLLARVAALLRRSGNKEEPVNLTVGDITLDRERFIVFRGEKSFDFPKKEFELLALLMSKPGKVFLREDILEKVWGGDVVVGDRTIDVHIRKIREKIGENYIRTIKGVGYKFDI